MGNTGTRKVITLGLRNLLTDTLTGDEKPNLPGDPDYVPGEYAPESCPVVTTLVCPVVRAAASGATSIRYTFSLPASVIANPAFYSITVLIKNESSVVVGTHNYTGAVPNFFEADFTGLSSSVLYSIDVLIKNSSATVIHTCEGVTTAEIILPIDWEAFNAFCVTTPECNIGFTYNEDTNTCEMIDEVAATPPSGGGGTPANAAHVSNVQWNNGGAQVFNAGYDSSGNGSIAATLTVPHFWVNGNFQWDAAGRNTVDSRMNAAGVWVAGETSNPVNEWIGFVRKLEIATTKTYYIAMSADNRFRFAINGTTLVTVASTGQINGTANFNFLNIYPVTLTAGTHYIEMWALNSGSVAGFAMEIYDNTLAQLIASDSIDDLTVIFTTQDMFGQPFDLGATVGYSCPAGYSLDDTGGGTPVCRLVTTETPDFVNTGDQAFEDRRRLVSGVPDGFEEPNLDGVGIGPYFPPISNPGACPP